MAIPMPEKYMRAELGIGKIANIQSSQADSKVCGPDKVLFGQGVSVDESVAKPFAEGATFFGVAIAKDYVDEINYGDVDKIGEYQDHEMIPVLRKGSIWVRVANDVKEGEQAKVIAEGKFDKAASATEAVGVFQSTAQKDSLAILQINLP